MKISINNITPYKCENYSQTELKLIDPVWFIIFLLLLSMLNITCTKHKSTFRNITKINNYALSLLLQTVLISKFFWTFGFWFRKHQYMVWYVDSMLNSKTTWITFNTPELENFYKTFPISSNYLLIWRNWQVTIFACWFHTDWFV